MRPLVLALALALIACGDDPKPIARVVEVGGAVERTPSATPPGWTAASVGDRLHRGAGVRTSTAARARLDVRGGGTLRMGPSSVVWFGAAPGAELLELEAGDAEVEAGDAEVVVGTRSGRARVRPGSRVRVQKGEDGDQLVVEVGAASIERADEAPVELAAGGRIALSAAPRRAAADAGVPVDAAAPVDASVAPDAVDSELGDQAGALSIDVPGGSLSLDPQPAVADFALTAGESATVHDPDPPSHVRIQLAAACPGKALVEVRRGRSRLRVLGDQSAVVALVPGSHTYAIRCRRGDRFDARPRVRGTLRIVQDAGRRSVDAAAPRNVIEADGRSYKVLYQNRRPVLVVRWPDAPRASGYVLTIQSGGAPRRYPSARPEVTIPSGAVDEGLHVFSFAADGTGRSSPQTRLLLDFDNAAPVAQLKEPSSPAAWSGDRVKVAGVATEGSTVSVGGAPLALDVHFRFTGEVAVAPDQRAIAVRIAQRGRRVHYFIRRRP
jgi:hypothetical protein